MSPTFARLRRPGLAAAAVLAVGLWVRLPLAYALTVALVPLAASLVHTVRRDPVLYRPVLPPPEEQESEGGRRDLDHMAWSLFGVRGKVSEEALRLLRPVAEQRLRRLGIDPDRPEGQERARELLGPRAWATLTCPGGTLPRVRDVEHTVSVLESLVPAASVPSASHAEPPTDAAGSRT